MRGIRKLRIGKRAKVKGILTYRALTVNNVQNVFLFLFYFDYSMLTYERYQALRAIYTLVPGEPENEARNKPESTLTTQVPFRACYRSFETAISCMCITQCWQ